MIGLQSNVPSSDLLFNKLAILASCGVNVFCDERGRFQTSGKRSFGVLFDPQYPVCAPLQELKILIRARPTLLLRTITLWGEAPGGGLMQDLADAGDMRRCAWTWVIADCRRNSLGLHSWNQSEDWRFDFSNQRPILVMRTPAFLAMRGAVDPRIVASIGARPPPLSITKCGEGPRSFCGIPSNLLVSF
jgi:hypothetical protein